MKGGAPTRLEGTTKGITGDETVPAEPIPSPTAGAPGPLLRGSTIGRYVIVDALASGGMGVVHIAYDPDLDRKLAIKLLHPAYDLSRPNSAGTTRLLREAQALAKLTHPNVVAVHDVGTHDGAVFLAMEFVDGETLGAWMAAGPRPWREVQRRFVAAGRGLAAAHAAGLVHRDFKPDNVLLGTDGRTRVADFGLARAGGADLAQAKPSATDTVDPTAAPLRDLTESAGPSTRLTRTGTVMGSPAYMAPEQHLGIGVGPKADQFSFCVALWEALYGQRPFSGKSISALALQTRAGTLCDPPRGLWVPGWLRRVMVRGLRPEPEDRYPSMDALLTEISRDPSATRQRWALGLAAAGLVGGSFAMVWRAEQDRAAACTGFDEALAATWGPDQSRRLVAAFEGTGLVYARDSATRVTDALNAYAGAWTAQAEASCQATRRGEQSERLLDTRTACLHRAQTEVGALVDVLVDADQDIVNHAVEAVSDLPPPERCADTERLLAASPRPEAPEMAARVSALEADLARAKALYATGRYKEAREVTAVVVGEADEIGYLPLVAHANFRLVTITTALHDPEATREGVRKAFTAGLASGEDRPAARAAYHMLWVDAEAGDAEAVEHWASLSGALVEKLDDDALRNNFASNHGAAYRRLGRLEDAQTKLEEALERAEARFGELSPEAAHVRVNLATVASDRGDFARFIELSDRSYEVFRRHLGEDHPQTATALATVAVAAFKEGRYAQAEEAMRRVLEIWTRTFGETSKKHADTLMNLAVILLVSGKVEEAISLDRRALDAYERLDGPRSVLAGEARTNLAAALETVGRLDEAHEESERAVEILEATLGSEDHRLAISLSVGGQIARKQNRLEQSVIDLDRAIAIHTGALGEDSPGLQSMLVQLALTRLDMGQPDAALAAVERALHLAQGQPLGPSSRGDMYLAHARALWDTGTDRKRARARGLEALAAYSEIPQAEAEGIAEVERWLETHGEH